jgi:hypothetical protein
MSIVRRIRRVTQVITRPNKLSKLHEHVRKLTVGTHVTYLKENLSGALRPLRYISQFGVARPGRPLLLPFGTLLVTTPLIDAHSEHINNQVIHLTRFNVR